MSDLEDDCDPIVRVQDDEEHAYCSSSSARLDPDIPWDPNDIDHVARPRSALQHLTENSDREFLSYTARINKCAAGLDDKKFVIMSYPEEMDNLNSDEIPLFYHVCITVLPPEMTGGFRFGDLRYLDQAGRAKATIMSLMISALCNPAHGSFFNFRDSFSPPQESYFFEVPKINRRFCKVYIVTETLFKKTYGVDSNGSRYELKIHELFNSKNVSGYRMWFMIADPNLRPTDAIISQINANIKQMGLGARARVVSPYTPALINHAQEQARASLPPDADIDRVTNETIRVSHDIAQKLNTKAARYNKEMRLARKEFNKGLQTGSAHDIRNAALEITSLVDFFNKLVCYEERCLNPNCINIQCEECSAKFTPSREFMSDPQLHIDPNRRHTPWLAHLDSISYRPIDASSEIGVTLNSCLENTGERSNILQLIDPSYHFNIVNTTTQKLCAYRGISVCADQLDATKYSTRDASERRIFQVPVPAAIFVYTSDVVYHPGFFDTRMPWCIDLRDFEISAIECYAQTQKRQLEKEHSRQFFSTINPDSRVTRTAAVVSEHWRRYIPESIPASLAGGEYDTGHDKTSVSILPSKQQQEDRDNRIVNIKDIFNKEGEIFRHFVDRLRKCSHFLTPSELQHVIGVIREEGRRVFQSAFRTTEQNTRVAKAAIQRLAHLSRTDRSAFSEIPIVARNVKGSFANYIIQQYAMAEAAGLLYTHTLFLRLRWAVMRAAHCHYTDAFFKKVTLLLNECFFGVAGAGKTYSAKVASEYLLPNSINIISSSSGASFANMENQGDTMKTYDEMRPAVCPGKPGDARDEQHLQQLKEQMTSHASTRNVTQLGNTESGVSDIYQRQILTIKSEDHSAIALFGNDAPTYERDNSYWTRFTVHVITTHVERCGKSDIASQAVNASGGSISDSTHSPHTVRQQWAITEHALNVAICRQIRVGALPYPNLDVLDYMWQAAYSTLREHFPSISAMSRAAERVVSLTLTLIITHAIYLVFNSPWSPLIHFDVDKQEVTQDTYNHDQLRAIAPLLRADEDVAIYAITSGLFLDFCPPEHHTIAKSIAETFGLLNTPTPQYATHRHMNQEFPNPNYVSCGIGAQIVRHIEQQFGHNRHTAIHVIGLLKNTTFVADVINPCLPSAPPTRRPLHVLTLTNTQDRTSPSPEVEMCMSTVHIAVEFVKKWSPAAVLELVMNAMSHNRIQERRVVIGQTIHGFPFLPNVWDLRRGTHSIDVSRFKEGKSYIRDALVGECAITREANEYRKHVTAEDDFPIDCDLDPETYLTVRWLKENVEIPPDIDPEYYTRVQIEKETERRLSEWFPCHNGKMYPNEIVEEYRRKNVAAGHSDEIEEVEDGDYFLHDFERAMEKTQAAHAASVASSSSSSSSTGPRVSKVAGFSEFVSTFVNNPKRTAPPSSSTPPIQKRPRT
jgi:hypothetical protein